jgi:small redox-active disulfide protein 2
MDIKVLGPGCANCRSTYALIEQVAREKGVPVTLTKVEDVKAIAASGILATPGVAIDGIVVHSGGVPPRARIEQWLTALAPAMATAEAGSCCGGGSKGKCCG